MRGCDARHGSRDTIVVSSFLTQFQSTRRAVRRTSCAAVRVAPDLVISILFRVPCPTPDGETARDLYEKRVRWITDDMRADARAHGCRYHRAWYARDGHAFYAIAIWETREHAATFYKKWNIADEPGEETITLEGDIGLAPEPPLP